MNAALSQNPGARLRAVREALDLTQEALAAELGESAYAVQISRWESNKAAIPPEVLVRFAAGRGLDPNLFYATGAVERVRRALEIEGYSLSATLSLDLASPAVVGFIAVDHARTLPDRLAVVCAPMIGRKQMDACLKILCRSTRDRISRALVVSEAEAEAAAAALDGTIVKGVEVHIRRPADVESSRCSLTSIASTLLRVTTPGPVRALVPHVVRDDESGPSLRADAAFDCWRRNIQRPSHLLLVGEPGSGKTMTLLRWARLLAQEHVQSPMTAPCPIYVELWSWWDATNFHRRLVQTLLEQLPQATQPRVEQAIGQGRFILLLDGLDELAGLDPTRLVFVERALDPLLRLPCRVVLTARSTALYPKDRGAAPDLGGSLRPRLPVTVARVQRLEHADVHAFLGSQRSDGGRALLDVVHQQGLSELARLPYILDALVDQDTSAPSALAESRPLMSRVLAPTYRRWVETDAPHVGVHPGELWSCFAQIASEVRRRSVGALPISDLPERLATLLRAREDQLCGRLPLTSRVIVVDRGAIRFVHRQIERFFFAAWVVDQVRRDRAEALAHVWLSPEDVGLLAGMLRDDEVITILSRWVSDARQDANLRDIATYALGFTGSKDALPTLRRVAL